LLSIKKSRPEGRDRIFCFCCLSFDKYYPAPFFKEVIKEKIESICDGVFHSESNIGIDRIRKTVLLKKIILTTLRSFIAGTAQKKSPSVETERPLTIACHMKKSLKAVLDRQAWCACANSLDLLITS
jgi:hypothetical protein